MDGYIDSLIWRGVCDVLDDVEDTCSTMKLLDPPAGQWSNTCFQIQIYLFIFKQGC